MTKTYWNSKKVLVAGGAGFIGSYLVELLIDDGAKVTVADNLSRGCLENLSGVMDKISFHNVDLRYLSRCEQVCSGQNIVLNLAAPAFGVEYSMNHHGEMLTDVTTIGFNLLEAARRQNIRRFLVVSSSCVYPDDADVPTKENEAIRGVPETVNKGMDGESEWSNCRDNTTRENTTWKLQSLGHSMPMGQENHLNLGKPTLCPR